MIAVANLTVRAGTFRLEGLSFTVESGRYAVLMGKTGSGKTTLLEALCGLKTGAAAGSVVLGGVDVTHCKPADRGIGYVPQDLALFPHLTVFDHLAFALTVRRWRRADIDQRVGKLAELLGLTRLLPRYPAKLSGGEAQGLVALGRAPGVSPQRILLLDEPLSALDEDTRAEMIGLLRSVQRSTGVTTLHVTHSLTEARRPRRSPIRSTRRRRRTDATLAVRPPDEDRRPLHVAQLQDRGRRMRRRVGRDGRRRFTWPTSWCAWPSGTANRWPACCSTPTTSRSRPSCSSSATSRCGRISRSPFTDGDAVTLLSPMAGG